MQLKEEVLKWIVHTKHLTKEEGLKMNMCAGDRSISRADYINIDILLCFILDLTGTYQFVVMLTSLVANILSIYCRNIY